MTCRSDRLRALLRVDWEYRDRERGYSPRARAVWRRAPRKRMVPARRRRVTYRRQGKITARPPCAAAQLRQSLAVVALLGGAALFLYCTFDHAW
jgi:hypothetical protein